MPYLHTPIDALSGVGAARKTAYNKMGIYTVEDLLYHFPRAYEHRGDIRMLTEARLDAYKNGKARMSTLLTVSTEPRISRIKGRMTLLKFRAFDDSGSCDITFFNQDFLRNTFTVGSVFRFYGRVEVSGKERYSMTGPAFEPYSESRPLPPGHRDKQQNPAHPAKENMGSSRRRPPKEGRKDYFFLEIGSG